MKNDKLVKIGSVALVIAVIIFFGVNYTAKAGTSFWGGIQELIAGKTVTKIFSDAPDFSVDDLIVSAMASPEVLSYMNVHGAFGWKMPIWATTTTSVSDTLLGADMAAYGMIDVMNMNTAAGSLNWTLPATSSMISILGEVGMTKSWLFHNATSSSGITLTFTAGTGMHLVGVAGAEVIDAEEWAQLTCTHIYYRTVDNEDILCIITELEE